MSARRPPPLLGSEMIALRGAGRLTRARGGWVLRTPSNPDFRFGNALWRERAPRPGDEVRWPKLFARHHGRGLRHRTFVWDGEAPSPEMIGRFKRLGYRHVVSDGLKVERYRPARRLSPRLRVELVRGASGWRELVGFQVGLRPGSARRRRFIRRLYAAYRALCEKGRGDWYVARLRGRVVGKLGLHHRGGNGRFQQVETSPRHRRRGVCTALLDFALRRAFRELGLRRVYIAADPRGAAIRVYRRAGFRRFAREDAFVRSPRGDAG